MSMRFVACSAIDCPMNQEKQCRAPFIMVDKEGYCIIKGNGPHDMKSITESYVDIRECRCKDCNNWEIDKMLSDETREIGVCGLGLDLFFTKRDVLGTSCAKCNTFEKQISKPGFSNPL